MSKQKTVSFGWVAGWEHKEGVRRRCWRLYDRGNVTATITYVGGRVLRLELISEFKNDEIVFLSNKSYLATAMWIARKW